MITSRMLDRLSDLKIGPYRLEVEAQGQLRYADQYQASLHVIDEAGRRSERPIFRGRCCTGRPSVHVPAWIDGEFIDPVSNQPDFREGLAALYPTVAQQLGALLPADGRLWIAYEAFDYDGPLHRETRAGLADKVPLIATPIGRLLFEAGCWTGLRNWDIAEGGREGPRKLQGNKALDSRHARAAAVALVGELLDFMQGPSDADAISRAQARAREIVPLLQSIVDG
jgi:hypothetical protein